MNINVDFWITPFRCSIHTNVKIYEFCLLGFHGDNIDEEKWLFTFYWHKINGCGTIIFSVFGFEFVLWENYYINDDSE